MEFFKSWTKNNKKINFSNQNVTSSGLSLKKDDKTLRHINSSDSLSKASDCSDFILDLIIVILIIVILIIVILIIVILIIVILMLIIKNMIKNMIKINMINIHKLNIIPKNIIHNTFLKQHHVH